MYTSSTSIQFMFNRLSDASARYTVSPFVYFSNDGGFLVVDYAVQVPETNSYWSKNYSEPSANINKPYDDDRTPALTFINQEDGRVLVKARIGNYSLTAVQQVRVELFVGDPDEAAAEQIGAAQIIPFISSRTREEVSAYWTPPSSDPVKLWVRVSSADDPPAFTPSKGYCPWPANATLSPLTGGDTATAQHPQAGKLGDALRHRAAPALPQRAEHARSAPTTRA